VGVSALNPRRRMLLLSVLVLAITIATRSISLARITSGSMAPTFCTGDLVVVKRTSSEETFRQGDIVIFHRESGRALVKRIVALQGIVRTDTDNAIVSGNVQLEPYACHDSNTAATPAVEHQLAPRRAIVLSTGEAFVMGDNRHSSIDSRDFGPIQLRHVEGKVLFRLFTNPTGYKCTCDVAGK
jgi:signal peptidase I